MAVVIPLSAMLLSGQNRMKLPYLILSVLGFALVSSAIAETIFEKAKPPGKAKDGKAIYYSSNKTIQPLETNILPDSGIAAKLVTTQVLPDRATKIKPIGEMPFKK